MLKTVKTKKLTLLFIKKALHEINEMKSDSKDMYNVTKVFYFK